MSVAPQNFGQASPEFRRHQVGETLTGAAVRPGEGKSAITTRDPFTDQELKTLAYLTGSYLAVEEYGVIVSHLAARTGWSPVPCFVSEQRAPAEVGR